MSSWHTQPLASVLDTLDSGPEGLTDAAAKKRLDEVGRNELKVSKDTSEIVKFLFQFNNFFAILLIVGGALAMAAERMDPGQGNLYIAIALLGVVLLNAAFTYFQEHQSERIMDSFKKLMPSMITTFRYGRPKEVPSQDLVPGDVIVLIEGDRVPADGRLISASELKVDNASLTGESEPQLLDADKTAATELESPKMVFSGSLVQNGEAQVVIVKTGMATQMGGIVQLTKATDAHETPKNRVKRIWTR